MANDLRSDEGQPILERETPKDYTFTVIPREDLMKMPEEEFVAYLVRLQGIAEILDEMVVGSEMLLKTRQSDLERKIKEAEDLAKQEKDDAVRLEAELEAKRQEMLVELEAKTAAAARNAEEADTLRAKLAALNR